MIRRYRWRREFLQPGSSHALLFCEEPQLACGMKNGLVIEAFICATEFMQKLSAIGRNAMTPCDVQQACQPRGKRRLSRRLPHFRRVRMNCARLFIDANVPTGIRDAVLCIRHFYRQN